MKVMNSLLFVSGLYLSILCAFVCGFLDIEELTDMRYALDISNKPLCEVELNPSEGLTLASRHGQNYYCKLPVNNEATKTESKEEKVPKTTRISTLLEPMRHESCLKTVKGWWTYEFCYGKYVKQYRSEDDVPVGEITYLGFYESDFDWNKQTVDDPSSLKRHRLNRYHSQSYVNGTMCDVVEHKRDTEIRFVCDDSSLETYIARVDEPSTCAYVITIHTPYICSHPHTRPLKNPKPLEISCRPILTLEDYTEYEEVTQARLKEKQEREEKLADARKVFTELTSQHEENQEEAKKIVKESDPVQQTDANSDVQMTDGADFFENIFDILKQASTTDSLNEMLKKLKKHKAILSNDRDIEKQMEGKRKEDQRTEAIQMIERFIVPERLQELDSFKQQLLVQNVVDLMQKMKDRPSADRVRAIEKYIISYVEAIENMRQSVKELKEFEIKLQDAFLQDSMNMVDKSETIKEDKKHQKEPVSVKLKVHQIKSLDELNEAKVDDLLSNGVDADSEDIDPSWKKLEQDIGRGLEDAGFETSNHIEIRLMTNRDSAGDVIELNDEDGERFRQMLLELVVGGSARKKEVTKQKTLNNNYNLVWKRDAAQFQSLSKTEEDSEDLDAGIKSPGL